MQTRIFYISLKFLSFDFPKKLHERRIVAGFSLLGGFWGVTPPAENFLNHVPHPSSRKNSLSRLSPPTTFYSPTTKV